MENQAKKNFETLKRLVKKTYESYGLRSLFEEELQGITETVVSHNVHDSDAESSFAAHMNLKYDMVSVFGVQYSAVEVLMAVDLERYGRMYAKWASENTVKCLGDIYTADDIRSAMEWFDDAEDAVQIVQDATRTWVKVFSNNEVSRGA